MVKKSMTEAEAIEVIRKAMEFSISAVKGLDKSKDKIDMVELAGEYYESKENCEQEVAACMLAINALKEIQEYRAIGAVEDLKNLCYLRKRYEDETYDYCGEYGTSECGAKARLERLKVYEAIGTVEEIKKAVKFLNFCYDSAVANDLHTLAEYRKIGTVEEIKEILQLISKGQEDVDESGISTGLLHTLLEYGQYKKIGALEECREAREKQKAKKVDFNHTFSKCPNCGNMDIHKHRYCHVCGQKLDWSRDGRYQDGVRKIQSD